MRSHAPEVRVFSGNRTRRLCTLAAAQEAGGANVLVPVLQEIERRGSKVQTIASAEAIEVFSREGIAHKALLPRKKEKDGMPTLSALFSEWAPDVLLLGTARGPSLDKQLLRVALAQGVPSVAVVDNWSNYRERFTDSVSGRLTLPTRIAVMDRSAFTQAVKDGLPEDRLVITGQPYLDSLATHLQDPDLQAQAKALREEWLQDSSPENNTRILLFASELVSEEEELPQQALERLATAVQRLERSKGLSLKIVLKLHPEEPKGSFSFGPLASSRSLRIVEGKEPAWPCILAADLVVGIVSIFLVEAAVAGKPVVSVQPSCAAISHPWIGSRPGGIPVASAVPELVELLRFHLTNPSRLPCDLRSVVTGNAAHRIADILLALASSRMTTVRVQGL